MDHTLYCIKSAVTNGGYVTEGEYKYLMEQAYLGDSDAKAILRSHSYREDNGYYGALKDPFRDLRNRDEGREYDYGSGADLF